jgi:outer membrane receptor protein involved in Fe transport
VARQALDEMAKAHPGVRGIVEYRQLTKAMGTYYEPLLHAIGEDGRVHSSFSSCRTVTGRLSSSDPNLMNIPRRDTLGGVRDCFVPEPGLVLMAADWRPVDSLVISANALTEFSEIADTYTSPRLGVNWRFAEGQALRASVSRSYRVFSAGEQLSDYRVVLSDGTLIRQLIRATGPGLPPERLTSYELGYLLERPSPRLSFDLKLFREEFRDGWSGARDPQRTTIWSGENGRWDTTGVEAQLRFAPDRETLIFGSYSYAETEGSEFTRIDAQGNPIEFESLDDTTPRHTLALQLSRNLAGGWSGTLALFHVSDMRWLGEGGEVDGYTRLDAKVSKAMSVGEARIDLALIGQNLMNDEYFEFRPDFVFEKPGNRFDRRVFVQLSVYWP